MSKEGLNFNLDFILVLSWLATLIFSKASRIENDVKNSLVDNLARAIQITQQMSQELALVDLHQSLQKLIIPEANGSKEEWQTFYNALQNILLTSREFKLDWKLTNEQYKSLADYLNRTKLLLECLELAYMSNREAILEQVLLPDVPIQEPIEEEPVEEQLPPVPVEEPIEEEEPPVKVESFGKWWIWLLVGLLIGGVLVGGLVIWMAS